MSKVRVDQLSPTDDSVTVNVSDLKIINDLAEVNNETQNLLNVAQEINNRKIALSSNIIRVCTWNVQAFLSITKQDESSDHYFDSSRFNRDLSSQQFVREHIEWLLKMGVDVVGIQEFYGRMLSKHQWSDTTSIGSNWRMYPYVDSFMAIETVSRYTLRRGFQGGNLILSTRKQQGGIATLLDNPNEGVVYRSCARSEINVNGVTVAVYSLHLSTVPENQTTQILKIVELVNSDTASHIVLLGDWNFNDDSGFAPLTSIGFTLASANGEINTSNYGGGATWYFDRILHRGFSSQGPVNTMTPPYELGDHKPMFCDLTL